MKKKIIISLLFSMLFSVVFPINILAQENRSSDIENKGHYIFDNYYNIVYNIEEDTSVEEFKENIDSQYKVTMYKLDEEVMNGSIEFGMTVYIENNEISKQYQIIDEEVFLSFENYRSRSSNSIFRPRLSSEGMSGNSYWYSSLNPFYSSGYGLPNCTAYAYGRLLEINNGINVGLPRSNAYQWYGQATNLLRGATPKLGAVICWSGGSGLGHVAVVEQIHSNGDIVTSESSYGGAYFTTKTYSSSNGYNSGSLRFQGFIYANMNEVTPDPQKNVLGDWVFQKTWGELNIGIWDYYEIEHTLRWIYLDVNTGQWHEIYEGTSNWISLLVDKGSYLVQVEVKDRNGNVLETKVAGTDGTTNSIIEAANVTREANGEYLLGAASNNPYVSYCIKLYNYNTGQWFTQYNSQWARFTPEAGVWYRVQFEIYGWGRLLDYQGYDFIG